MWRQSEKEQFLSALTIPGGGFDGEPGQPSLPTFTRLIAVPDRAGVQVTAEIIDEEERLGVRLAPMTSGRNRGRRRRRELLPRRIRRRAIVTAGEPAILRDLRVCP